MSNIKGTYKDDKGVVRDIREMPNLALEVMKMQAEAKEIDEAETFLEDLVSVKKEDVLLKYDIEDAPAGIAEMLIPGEEFENRVDLYKALAQRPGWFRKHTNLSNEYLTELERQLYESGRDRIRARRRRARQAANRRKKH